MIFLCKQVNYNKTFCKETKFSLRYNDVRTCIAPKHNGVNKANLSKSQTNLFFYAPNFEKVGDILVSACPYVCLYVCMYVCMYICIHVRDIVLKLHVWIPHGKIADAYFWFSLNYLPLSNYGPLTNKGMKFCKCRISKSIIARNLNLVSADRG